MSLLGSLVGLIWLGWSKCVSWVWFVRVKWSGCVGRDGMVKLVKLVRMDWVGQVGLVRLCWSVWDGWDGSDQSGWVGLVGLVRFCFSGLVNQVGYNVQKSLGRCQIAAKRHRAVSNK